MVGDLSHLRDQAEISVHLVVKKRSDACRSQAKRFGSKIHSLTNSTCFEMHISISTIAVTAGRILKIADHRECQASVTRQVLSQTESCRHQAPSLRRGGCRDTSEQSELLRNQRREAPLCWRGESQVASREINSSPPLKSRAERRVRTTSPKLRLGRAHV